MKNFRELIRFITLSGYSDADYIEAMVLRHHEKWASRYSKWSYESTKQKLMSAYRTWIVLLHFFSLLSLTIIVSFLLRFKVENLSSFAVIVMCFAVIIYFILRAILYNPIYVNDYLPLLNHVVEKLSGDYLKELDGVKKGQYSAVSIVLIQAVTNKLAGFPKPTGSKITKDQLAKLYGVSERSFHDALNIVLKANWKSGPRIDREIADAFGEAKEYFSVTGSEQAVKLLDSIKLDVLVKRLPPTY